MLVCRGIVEVEEVFRLLTDDDRLQSFRSDLFVVAEAEYSTANYSACYYGSRTETYSSALRARASAPIRPRPTNVSSGLWYTLAREEISPISSSSNAGDTVVRWREIGGRCASMTDYTENKVINET